jgi:hypothetical protein
MKCLKKSSNNRIKGTAKIGGFSKLSHPLYVCRFIKSPRHALLPPLMRAVIFPPRYASVKAYFSGYLWSVLQKAGLPVRAFIERSLK